MSRCARCTTTTRSDCWPSARTRGGYRQYAEADLDRLHQILFYRELGFSLDEIATVVDEPGVDTATRLRHQHKLLRERIAGLQRMAAAVEKPLEAYTMGISLTSEEKFELFGDFDPDGYAEEAEQRWGGTEAWRQSQRTTVAYTKQDWAQIRVESDELNQALAQAMRDGAPADGTAPWTSPSGTASIWGGSTTAATTCTAVCHMYVDDEWFTAHYERIAPGLAAYLNAAIQANADRQT